MDELLKEFLLETEDNLNRLDAHLLQLEKSPDDKFVLQQIFRLIHTIKGSCGFLKLPRLQALTHATEDALEKIRHRKGSVPTTYIAHILNSVDAIRRLTQQLKNLRQEPIGDDGAILASLQAIEYLAPESQTKPDIGFLADSVPGVRVPVETLEELLAGISELVLLRNEIQQKDNGSSEWPVEKLSAITAQLQDSVMKSRLQPVANLWRKLPRQMREMAQGLGKEIDLEMSGMMIRLDRQILESLRDPIMQILRNALSHGIESTDSRIKLGKPPVGRIKLQAWQDGSHATIKISDDGNGLNAMQIRNKAVQMGLLTHTKAPQLNVQELHNFIFKPGFSTASQVTAISGRGIGLDIVKSSIENLGGSVDVETVPGKGTDFILRVPTNLSIIPAVIVQLDEYRMAIPQMNVREIIACKDQAVSIQLAPELHGLHVGDQFLPLMDLNEQFGLAQSENELLDYIVILESHDRDFALMIDQVHELEEIVVKPLSRALGRNALFSGAAILGDGHIAAILNVYELASQCQAKAQVKPASKMDHQECIDNFLIFRIGDDTPKAIPLTHVLRIAEANSKPIILIGESGRFAKIMADEIIDIRIGRILPATANDKHEQQRIETESGWADILNIDPYLAVASTFGKKEM